MDSAVWDRLSSLLGLGAETLDVGQMALRAALTFLVTLALVRLGDKRLFGKGTAFDLVVAIMLGSVMSCSITESSPLSPTWAAGLVLIILHRVPATLRYHLGWFGLLVKGRALLLVQDGQLLPDGIRDGSIIANDLDQALRRQGRTRTTPASSVPTWSETTPSASSRTREARRFSTSRSPTACRRCASPWINSDSP